MNARPASVLDGFFTRDVERVAAAANALLRTSGLADADRSWGRVTRASASPQERKGIWSEAIFGPTRVLACGCGAVQGEAHAGVKCATCGVLCADPSLRDWRFGHVELPLCIHPLLLPQVASALAIPVADVEAVLRVECVLDGGQVLPLVDDGAAPADALGAQAIGLALEASGCASALCDAALVRRVPVPPPGDRPPIEDLVAGQRLPWIGPANAAWLELVELARDVAHLERRGAPAVRIARAAAELQAALALVVERAARPPALHEVSAWSAPRHAARAPDVGAPPPRGDLVGRARARAVFVDEHTLLVQRGPHVVHVDIDGKVLCRFASPARALRSVHVVETDEGRHTIAAFDGWLAHPMEWPLVVDAAGTGFVPIAEVAGSLAPLAVYDLTAETYLAAWPDDVASVSARQVASGVHLVDARTGAVARGRAARDRGAAGVHPYALAWTRDARFAWLGTDDDGAVLDVATGIPLFQPRVVDGREDGAVESPRDVACALGVADAGATAWRFVHFDGALSDGTRVLAQLGVFEAVAFSPSCAWIAAVRGRDVEIYDERGHLSRRFALERAAR